MNIENKLKISEFNRDIYNSEYIITDMETSGLDPNKGAEVIRIVAYKIKNGIIIDRFYKLIKTKKLLSKNVEKIVRINNKELNEKGIEYDKAIICFYEWLGCIPVVSYNLSFMYKFINFYNEKYKIAPLKSKCFELKWIVRQKYKNIITQSPKKMLEIINPNALNDCDENDKYFYLDMILHILKMTYEN